MRFIPSVFQRLLEPLDRRVVNRIVAEHGGNRNVGEGEAAWTCQRHLTALLFAQYAGLSSLREIEEGLSSRPTGLYHLGLRPPRRSTLSDASAARPAAVFGDLCQYLAAKATRSLRVDSSALIRLLDATPIPLKGHRFDWAEADARIRGLKLHLVLDPDEPRPVGFAITSPKVSDIKAGRAMLAKIEPGTTFVFDKAYTDYAWWQQIEDAGAFFVTRLKANAHRRDLRLRPAMGDGILADRSLRIGHKQPRGGAGNPLYDTELREVVVERQDKPPLHIVTNDHKRSAVEIADLYRRRWEIELFFKWIKQNLKIKSFLGSSENAVKIQIFVALIAFLLLHLFRLACAHGHKAGAKALITRIKVALFDRLDLTYRAKPPPRQPNSLPPNPQLNLPIP